MRFFRSGKDSNRIWGSKRAFILIFYDNISYRE